MKTAVFVSGLYTSIRPKPNTAPAIPSAVDGNLSGGIFHLSLDKDFKNSWKGWGSWVRGRNK